MVARRGVGEDEGKEYLGSWDRHVHTAIFKMGNQQGPTVQHRELCSKLCGSLDGRGMWGENGYMCQQRLLQSKLQFFQ